MKKKILYIPGWMDRMVFHGCAPEIDIWSPHLRMNETLDADVIVAYSLGCVFALSQWNPEQNKKIILINPPFKKKPFHYWMWQWIKFFFGEGVQIDKQRLRLALYLPLGIFKAYRLFQKDFSESLKAVAPCCTVIRGSHDCYFCDRDVVKELQKHKIPVMELNGVGHEWDDTFLDVIKSLLNKDDGRKGMGK